MSVLELRRCLMSMLLCEASNLTYSSLSLCCDHSIHVCKWSPCELHAILHVKTPSKCICHSSCEAPLAVSAGRLAALPTPEEQIKQSCANRKPKTRNVPPCPRGECR
ncbi:hypothetical protein BKA80DRAFT_9152 [Phyllosticta citrichinensis]